MNPIGQEVWAAFLYVTHCAYSDLLPCRTVWLTWLLETRLVDTVFKNTPGSKPVLTRLLLRWTRIKGPRASEHSQLAGGDPR